MLPLRFAVDVIVDVDVDVLVDVDEDVLVDVDVDVWRVKHLLITRLPCL